jgi:hypothetical protein
VIVTVLPHPDHADWFDLSFVYWGFITHETVESAALRVLTEICDHNPTVVALSLFGLFPAVSPHNPAWLDRMDQLWELLLLASRWMTLRRWPIVLTSFSHFRGCVTTPQRLSDSAWRQLGGIGSSYQQLTSS